MTRKQLQTLISAGVFSAALLSGVAYADDTTPPAGKGQGGCKTSDGGCSGKNSCKGKGGCATDGTKMPG